QDVLPRRPAASPPALLLQEIAPGVLRQRPQPAAETARGVVLEARERAGQLDHHHLRHVLGVGLLKTEVPTPGVDQRAVALNELVPRRLVARALAQPNQQRRSGRW